MSVHQSAGNVVLVDDDEKQKKTDEAKEEAKVCFLFIFLLIKLSL